MVSKACLVTHDFEEIDNSELPKDSPSCTMKSFRVVFALCYRINGSQFMDIKTVFLQGSKLSCEVFICLPDEVECNGKIWLLQKCVYGLVDASLYWYSRVRQAMLQCSANISSVDPAIFYQIDNKRKTFWKGMLMISFGKEQRYICICNNSHFGDKIYFESTHGGHLILLMGDK